MDLYINALKFQRFYDVISSKEFIEKNEQSITSFHTLKIGIKMPNKTMTLRLKDNGCWYDESIANGEITHDTLLNMLDIKPFISTKDLSFVREKLQELYCTEKTIQIVDLANGSGFEIDFELKNFKLVIELNNDLWLCKWFDKRSNKYSTSFGGYEFYHFDFMVSLDSGISSTEYPELFNCPDDCVSAKKLRYVEITESGQCIRPMKQLSIGPQLSPDTIIDDSEDYDEFYDYTSDGKKINIKRIPKALTKISCVIENRHLYQNDIEIISLKLKPGEYEVKMIDTNANANAKNIKMVLIYQTTIGFPMKGFAIKINENFSLSYFFDKCGKNTGGPSYYHIAPKGTKFIVDGNEQTFDNDIAFDFFKTKDKPIKFYVDKETTIYREDYQSQKLVPEIHFTENLYFGSKNNY